MAERLRYNAPSVFSDRAPQVNYDNGTVALMDQLSGAFLDVAQKAHRAELESNVAQAKVDGALAGSRDGMNFRPSKGRGIVHRTYNDSGIQSATVKMSLKSREAISRIAVMNPGNPFAQKQAMESWADGFAQELPQEMIAPFRNTFDQLAAAQLTAANKELGDIRQSEAVASFNDFEASIINSVELYAPKMFLPGAVGTDASKAIETLRKNYVELLAQNGPGVGYTVQGYEVPPAAGRSDAFSVEEIGKKIEEFDKMVLGSAVKGDFLRELEAGRGVGSYFNFVKGTTALTMVGEDGTVTQVPVDNLLTMDDKQEIASYMRTHISTLNSIEAAQDRKIDRAKEKYNEAILDQATQAAFSTEQQADGSEVVVGNADVLRMHYLNAINDQTGMVSLETIEGLQSLMETVGSGEIADPQTISETNLKIINRNIAKISELPTQGLGDEARGEAVQMIRKINSGQHWSNSQRYTSMLTLGKAALAPEAATGFNLFSDPNSASAADFAEFQESLMSEILAAEKLGILPADINALPTKEEFDIQGRARELIKEIKERRAEGEKDPEIDALNSQIKNFNDILNNPDTPDDEAKRVRNELKRVMDQKTKLQSSRLGLD